MGTLALAIISLAHLMVRTRSEADASFAAGLAKWKREANTGTRSQRVQCVVLKALSPTGLAHLSDHSEKRLRRWSVASRGRRRNDGQHVLPEWVRVVAYLVLLSFESAQVYGLICQVVRRRARPVEQKLFD